VTGVRRGITARELIRALHRDGFEPTRTRGSHHIYRHSDGRRVVAAYHRLGDTVPIGTLAGMITDIGWPDTDLRRPGIGG
jgi:predicted RNA binding protein YcfA (HicA-like mRNA interferase family)